MKTKVTLCCVALSVIFGNAAIAQKPTDPPAHPVRVATGTGFGTTSDTVVTLSARDMQPYEPGGGVTGGDDGFNYRWMTAGSNKLFIGGVNVPTGVTITGISIHYCDIDAASSFILRQSSSAGKGLHRIRKTDATPRPPSE